MSTHDITCCFTGHRPMKLPWGQRETDPRCIAAKDWIKNQITELYASGYRRFLCGMAIGCDMYFAEAVLELKKEHDDILLEAALPCLDQSSRWNNPQKLRYSALLEQCNSVHTFQNEYSPGCMQQRNKYMVDESAAILSCFDGRPGGTMSTLLYAQRQGLDVRILDVSDITTEKYGE